MGLNFDDLSPVEDLTAARHRGAIAALSELALDNDLDRLLRRVAEAASYALGADFCAVLELAPDGESMRTRAAFGTGSPMAIEIKADSAFSRLLMAGGEIALNDPYMAGRVPRWLPERMAHGISHRIGRPPAGFGALCAFRSGSRRFDSGDLEFLRVASNLATMAVRLNPGAAARHESARQKKRTPELIAGFLANTSHEIRNPLHVILGYNEIIADHLRERGDSLAPVVAAVERAGRRLLDTIERLLAYSRLESDAVEARAQDIVLAPLVEALAREFAPRAAAKGIAFSAGIDEPAMAARCDPDHLAAALDNLADNAIKFTERGEIAVRLYRGLDGEPAIRIRDTGVGIDPAYLPHLFEPFSQEQSSYSRRFEGSGLGLALARRYLELNGATITVDSKKGAGSIFTIHLPASRTDTL